MSYAMSLTNRGFKQNSTLAVDGVKWPNWGINVGLSSFLETSIISDNIYRYYKLTTGLAARYGRRYTFCIQRQSSTIQNIYIIFSSLLSPPANSTTLAGITGSTTIYYSSIDNKYYINHANGTLPALYTYPNIDTDNGQIYFRIEEDGKIYSGFSKQTASLIGTMLGTGRINVGIVTFNNTGTGSGVYKMIPHTINDPPPTSIPIQYINIFKLPNDDKSQSFDASDINKWTIQSINNESINNLFGIDMVYYIHCEYNDNESIIGFNWISPTGEYWNKFMEYDEMKYIYAYYNSSTGECIINEQVVATLDSKIKDLFLRIDGECNFYVGISFEENTRIGNLKDYINYEYIKAFPPLFTIQIHHVNNLSSYFEVIQCGYNLPSNLDEIGYTFPNYGIGYLERILEPSNIIYSVYKIDTDIIIGNRYSFSFECTKSGIDEFNLVLTNNAQIDDVNAIIDSFGSTAIFYNSNDNAYYKNDWNYIVNAITSPDITKNKGTLYFRVEQNGECFSGKTKDNEERLGNLNAEIGDIYNFKIIIKGGSGVYRFIENV